jgi:phosphatidate cytidylyltransferase
VAAVLVLAVAAFTRLDPRAGFLTWATSSFGVAYISLLLPFVALVGHLGPADGSATTQVGGLSLRAGTAWLFTLLLLVWGYDTGAYLTGRWIGRRRLIDHVSPAKTVEGLAGGLVAATIAAGIGTWLTGMAPWHALVIGPLIGLVAQAGDLAESLLKRAAGRKDSGFLFPGHGGMLDRVDSFLFAAPVLAGYALLVVGAGT